MILKQHQKEKGEQVFKKLFWKRFIFLIGEMRSGKTGTALYATSLMSKQSCYKHEPIKVLVVSTIEGLKGIAKQHKAFGFKFEYDSINYQSAHKVVPPKAYGYEVIIFDESHYLSGNAVEGKDNVTIQRCKTICELSPHAFILCLTGTPAPNSYAKMYYQASMSPTGPFEAYPTFKDFGGHFSKIYLKRSPNRDPFMAYDDIKEDLFMSAIKEYKVTITQEEAGIKQKNKPKDVFIDVHMSKGLAYTFKKFKKDKVVRGERFSIKARNGAEFDQKMHQLEGGCIIFNKEKRSDTDRHAMILCTSKAEYIKNNFYDKGKRICIAYNFVKEKEAIEKVFGEKNITFDPKESEKYKRKILVTHNKPVREGVDLSYMDAVFFYNMTNDYITYKQLRSRMTNLENKKEGIKIYFMRYIGGYFNKVFKKTLKNGIKTDFDKFIEDIEVVKENQPKLF